ncbi:MAG TPA: hypothetical protein VGD95_06280 [Micavibrio sp.]
MDLPVDLPGNIHGAPTVQVAQAFQKKCAASADGSERYRVGQTPYELVIGFKDNGQRTYKFEEKGKPAALQPRNAMNAGGGRTTLVMFNDNSSLQILSSPRGTFMQYKDAKGTAHAVTPLTQTLQETAKLTRRGPVPQPCVS